MFARSLLGCVEREITTSVSVPALPAEAASEPVLQACRCRQETIRKVRRWSKSNTSSRVWAEVWAGRFFLKARNDKALKNQGSVVYKMAEAMRFELMGLLQSTVFKTVSFWPRVYKNARSRFDLQS